MEPLVALAGFGVSLGGGPVLRDIDLTLQSGEALGLAGPNGSGKTTLIRAIATLVRSDSGHGEVLGATLGTEGVYPIRAAIGLIGHVPALVPELTLAENLSHIARLAGIDVARVDSSIAVVGLEDAADRRADACSHGMLRRAEIALLFLRRPRLVLIDEAASGLDSDAAALVSALTDRTTSDGGAVVIVSHDGRPFDRCDRVIALSEGRIEVGS